MPSLNPLILIVDDEAGVLELIALTLEQAGYRTLKAICAEDALTLAQGAEEPDVLVTDLELPGMSGFKLAARFTRLHPLTRILFVSGSPMHTAFDATSGVFPFPFLAKPFQLQELRTSIATLLRNMKGSGLSPALPHEKSASFAG
jgi:CheY-like chemotaxis protein